MIPAAVLLACPNLAVPARLMYHVAEVESDANPYAIGVVGGRLLRQPASLDEAIVTARSLEAQGYNFSVGVAQVNHANLKKYGLDTYEKAFSICGNLLAGSRILAQCYADAAGVWGKAFSCYYSGDFTTGYRDGYVQRVLTSLSQGGEVGQGSEVTGAAAPIPVLPSADSNARVRGRSVTPDSAAWRIAIRSSVLDTAANAVVARAAQKLPRSEPKDALQGAAFAAAAPTQAGTSDARTGWPASTTSSPTPIPFRSTATATAAAAGTQGPTVFVPQVSDLKAPTSQGTAPESPTPSTLAASAPPPGDSSDAAFVF
jgi:type IV secretion system protein VirB1